MKKLIQYYVLRAVILLIYAAIGLVLFSIEVLWNHGLFGGGADVVPVVIEIAVFFLWAISGLVALFYICGKRISRSIYTVLVSCGILGIVFVISHVLGDTIPNFKKSHEINVLRSNAEVEFEVDTRPGTAYHTFFFDEDTLQLSQWARYEKDVAKAYNWIYFFHGEKAEVTVDKLPLSQMKYEIYFDEGVLRCFSDENYYDSIDFMYLDYRGQTYYFAGGHNWLGERLPDWTKKSEEMFRVRMGN